MTSVKYDGVEIPSAEYTVSYEDNTDAGTAKVVLTDKNGGNYTINGSKDFEIKPLQYSKPDANVVKANPPSVIGKPDGSIVGVTLDMEYSTGEKDEQGNYIYHSVTGTSITGLKPGVYYVRYAADDNHDASEELMLEVEESEALLTMTFASNGGSTVKTGTAEYNKAVAKPTAPTWTGHTFKGWYTDNNVFENEWNFETKLTENVTLYAKWEINQYTITFDSNGGSAVAAITQDYDTDVTAPVAPTWHGHVFIGWDKEIPSKMPAANITITAQWEDDNMRSISFVTELDDGKEIVHKTISEFPGAAITVKAPEKVERTGYTFNGWSTTEYPTVMPQDGLKIYATWTINQYTITFDTDGGSEIASITQDYGTAVTKPQDPTKTGNTFDGWNTEIPSTMPAEDVTIKANWKINEYTVTFNSNGGSTVESKNVNYNNAVSAPGSPSKEGNTFGGWYTDNGTFQNSWNFQSDKVVDNMTLYAKWTVNKYKLTFNSDNGSSVTVIEQEFGSAITKPQDPEKEGHEFEYWMVNNNKTDIPSTMPAKNMAFTAKWKVNEYTIIFHPDNGEDDVRYTLPFGSPITAPTVSKENNQFDGWNKTIPATMPASDQPIEITALWIEDGKYTVKFVTKIDEDNEVVVWTSQSYYKGETIDYTEFANPSRDGFNFNGWAVLVDGESKDLEARPTTMPEGGLTAYAKWSAKTYTVQYVTNGGSAITSASGLTYNSSIPQPEDNPSKDGHTFSGWFTDQALNTLCDFTKGKVTDNMTLYAKWTKNTYTVTFKNYDDSAFGDPLTYEYDDVPKYKGDTPERPGTDVEYTFTGWTWVDDNNKENFVAKDLNLPNVTRNVTYTAKFSARETKAPMITSIVLVGAKTTEAIEAMEKIEENGEVTYRVKYESIECVGDNGIITITAEDDNSGISQIVYTIDGGEAQVYTEQFDLEPGTYTISVTATDKAGNPSESVVVKAVVRQEATLPQDASYTYTQLSKKDVVLDGLDLHGATIEKITIDGTNIWNADKNALNSGILDKVKVGEHKAKLFTLLNGASHDTGKEFTLTVNGFEIDFDLGEREGGYCPGEKAEITLKFKDWNHPQTPPTWYKLDNGDYQEFTSLKDLVATLPLDITNNGEFKITFKLGKESNTQSEVKDLKVKVKGSSELIIQLFDDLIAIDNHEDRFIAYQWYKDGKPIDGNQQYWQCPQNEEIKGVYSAIVTLTDGNTLEICSANFGEDLSKSFRRSVNVYPNPARSGEEVTIELLNFADVEYEGCVIRIVNALGATVTTINNCDRINTVSLPSGTYTGYVIRNGGNDKVSFKLIVK